MFKLIRNNMQRLKTWIINIPNIPTMLAFRVLTRAIRKDPAYAEGWQANIAMSVYDESRSNGTQPLSAEFCNRATARFMKICFGVDTRCSN